jgi:hypothetical protein
MSCALRCRRGQDVGLICYQHHDQLADLLDPRNTGSEFDPARPADRRVIASIPVLHTQLDAHRSGTGIAAIGSSAFGPRSPADDDVIVLRDPRSRASVFGADDVERAPRPTLLVLAVLAERLFAVRAPEVAPRWTEEALSGWLYGSLRLLASQEWVPEAWDELRSLQGALRAQTGDPPPRSIGTCRVLVDDEGQKSPAGPWRCAVPLFLPELPPRAPDEPFPPPALRCSSCGHRYTGGELIDIARNPLVAAG